MVWFMRRVGFVVVAVCAAAVLLAVVPAAGAQDGGGSGEVTFGDEEGLLPDVVFEAQPEPQYSLGDILDAEGVYEWADGDRSVPMRPLPEGVVFDEAGVISYVPPGGVDTNSTTATNWVSDTGQRYVLDEGVIVILVSGVSAGERSALWSRHGIAESEVERLGGMADGFVVASGADAAALALAGRLAAEPLVASALPNWHTPRTEGAVGQARGASGSTRFARQWCGQFSKPWSDELSACLWHLDADTEFRSKVGPADPVVDVNIGDVWQVTRGEGVAVAVVDRTWQSDHEDIAPNADLSRNPHWCGLRNEAHSNAHGTMVAGIVGARDNAVGGRGVAPRATLYNYNYLSCQSEARFVESWTLNKESVAVANHSYGTSRRGPVRESAAWWAAMETSLAEGFGGKGTVHVKSAGNNHAFGGMSSLEESHNHRGVMSVCSVNASGVRARYSETGPQLWVCAPSKGSGDSTGILAPQGRDDYTLYMGGTSAAAPQVAGVAALVRSANPHLSWRDVKLVIADTAAAVHASHGSWLAGAPKYSDSGDNYRHSIGYGFGMVDAEAAVEAALGWAPLPDMKTAAAASAASLGTEVPGTKGDVELELDIAASSIDFIEHVNVELDMDTVDFRDFTVTLVSPTGRESVLSKPKRPWSTRTRWDECDDMCGLEGSFKFGTARHLGEAADGAWKLRIRNDVGATFRCTWPWGTPPSAYSCVDIDPATTPAGTVNSWGVTVWGHDSTQRQGAPTGVLLRAGADAVLEGASLTVTADLVNGPLADDLVVPVVLTAGTATGPGQPGADYSDLAWITIPAGDTTATATISLVDDGVDEPFETFTVGMGSLPGGVIAYGQTTEVTIADEEGLYAVSITAGAAVIEGKPAKFGVSAFPAPSSPLDVAVAVSQQGDFGVATGTQTVTVPTTGTATLTVATTADSADEPDGSVTVAAVSGSGYRPSAAGDTATVRIKDDYDPCRSYILADGTQRGTWSKGAGCASTQGAASFARWYVFSLAADSEVTLDLRSSYDTFLIVRRGADVRSGQAVVWNDDGGQGSNSLIKRTFAEGTYTVEATAWGRREGSFTLAVTGVAPPDPEVSITAGAGVTEGSAAAFTVTAAPAPDGDIDVAVTVAQRGDWDAATGTQTITIPTTGTAALSIPTVGDSTDEPDGAVTVTLGAGTGYSVSAAAGSASVAVSDDDATVVSLERVTSVSAVSGGARFSVSLGRELVAGERVVAPVGISGVDAGDFVVGLDGGGANAGVSLADAATLSPSVEFSGSGAQAALLSIEAVVPAALRLPSSFGGPVPSASGGPYEVVNDSDVRIGVEVRGHSGCNWRWGDPPPPPAPFVLVPGERMGTDFLGHCVRWTMWLTPEVPSCAVTVRAYRGGKLLGTSAGNTRIGKQAGWLVHDNGSEIADADEVRLVPVCRYDPNLVWDGPARTVSVELGDVAAPELGTNLSGGAVAADDGDPDTDDNSFGFDVVTADAAPVVLFEKGGYEASEAVGSRTVEAQVKIIPKMPHDVAVSYAIGGTAASGTDYSALSGQVTIPANAASAPIAVSVLDDAELDPAETVELTITASSGGYLVGHRSKATVEIADDDNLPVASVTGGAGVVEGAAAVFTVTVSPAPPADLAVSVSVSQQGDYGVATGTRTVTIGTSGTATLTVDTAGDSTDEADGSVTATVSTGSGYAVSATAGSASVAVSDDDDPPAVFTPNAALVAEVTALADAHSNAAAAERLRRIVKGMTGEAGGYTAAECRGTADDYSVGSRWKPWCDEIERRENSQATTPTPTPTPTVSIAAGSGVTEGASAVFTVTADPAPASDLTVSVSVSQQGDYGVTTGTQTVTVATSGTATLSIPTVGDGTDEADGSVTATLAVGTGYDVSSSNGAATVSVSDDDDPPAVFTPDAALVAEVTDKANAHSNAAAAERLRRVVMGMTGETGGYTAVECRDTAAHHGVGSSWKPWCDEIERRENWQATTPPPPVTPTVSIAAGSGVTEGSNAVFTLTASPAPTADLTVNVTVSAQGDYGVSTGTRTVTIGTSGTATLSVDTAGDDTDEADGSVTATLATGSGYTVSASNGAATVSVSDDDDPLPPPVTPTISIAAGSGVTEGTSATFTLTANPAPASSLTVNVTIAQKGDFGVSTGSRSVTIGTSGTATLSVATAGDGIDEADGSVTATLATGSGYAVSGSRGSATVAVSDDDDPPVPDPVPVPPGDAISSDADALALAASERDRYASLRSGPRAALYWMLWIRAGGIIDALNGRSNLANNPDNGWYRFRSTITHAVNADDTQAVHALTRLGEYFITRYNLRIDPAGHYNSTWPTL